MFGASAWSMRNSTQLPPARPDWTGCIGEDLFDPCGRAAPYNEVEILTARSRGESLVVELDPQVADQVETLFGFPVLRAS
jgi:hypothetical protein